MIWPTMGKIFGNWKENISKRLKALEDKFTGLSALREIAESDDFFFKHATKHILALNQGFENLQKELTELKEENAKLTKKADLLKKWCIILSFLLAIVFFIIFRHA